jgi:hypothetical protein
MMSTDPSNWRWHLSNLPQRPEAHATGDRGVRRFCELFTDPWFIVREESRNDYGVDAVIEALAGNGRHPTNVRCHAQIKSSNRKPNTDGSFTCTVGSSNLNYLLNSPNSFYVFYSTKQDVLYYCSAESAYRRSRKGKNVTVTFRRTLDIQAAKEIHHTMLSVSLSIRDLLLSPGGGLLRGGHDFVYTTDEEGRVLLLHNMIWEDENGRTPEGYGVYHINGDFLDNRRENLALRPVEHPFPLEEFQIEISNAQLYNVLSIVLEGDSASALDDVPPPPKKMFEYIVNSLISQGWYISEDSLQQLQHRMRARLSMRI